MSFIELVAQRHPPKPPAGMQPPENAKEWFSISNSADEPDTTDILVYDSIGGWFGMWAEDFIDALSGVGTSKINLRLNSPGGSVFEGIAIANAIRQHPANVTVYVDSIAASIASVIAMAGDRLVMMPQSQIMVHNASGACYGDATEMTKMADMLDKQSLNIAQAYAQHTGRPLAEWQQYMDAETWFTAEEALAVGLADEVVPMRAKQSAPAEENDPVEAKMHRSWDLSMYQHAGRGSAPAPKLPVQAGGAGRALEVVASALPGQLITAELVASPGALSNMSQEDLVALIRDAVREEVAAALPAFLQPDEDEEEEEEEEESQPDDSLAADPTEPDREEQPVTDETDPPPVDASVPEGTPPDDGDQVTETHDEADDWNSVVGFLVSPATSPSADDVFAQLKEGW
jgi:ATP-dependent Clp endopeptidase proteolytic subunit ClpP